MNKLEVQQNSQDCIEINDEATTVYMKHAASLGELLFTVPRVRIEAD